jgi:predicted DNA binding CopG/RHH family protein
MKYTNKNPFKNIILDQEEKEITRAVESGKVRTAADFQKSKKLYQTYAGNTLEKSKNINIRISERDLARLKAKAIEDGVPYQTLVGSLIHKFTNVSG